VSARIDPRALRLRLGDVADAAPLAAFMERNFRATYGHCSTPANVDAAVLEHYGLEAQRRQLADPMRQHLLVEGADGVLLGHAQLRHGHDAPAPVAARPAAEVTRFYVDGPAHGRGVAQAMLAEVERLARARAVAALWLSVWQEQPQAVRFYEKSGFVRRGTLVFVVGDDPKDDWLMVKGLGAASGAA
jgi:ribosomal protein S18 acetylase RimI-like enzyme